MADAGKPISSREYFPKGEKVKEHRSSRLPQTTKGKTAVVAQSCPAREVHLILNVNDGKVVVSWRDLLSRLFDGPDWAVEGGDPRQVLVRWSPFSTTGSTFPRETSPWLPFAPGQEIPRQSSQLMIPSGSPQSTLVRPLQLPLVIHPSQGLVAMSKAYRASCLALLFTLCL